MPDLQVPAGEEGGHGVLPNLQKEEESEENEENEENEEEKKGGDCEEKMEGKRRDKDDRDSGGHPGGGRGHDGKIPLSPFCHLSPSPAAPPSRFFSTRRSKTTL